MRCFRYAHERAIESIAFFLGLLLCFLPLSRNVVSRWLWKALASAMMGVPSILVVFFIYYNSSLILEQVFGTSPEITPFIAGVTGLAIVTCLLKTSPG